MAEHPPGQEALLPQKNGQLLVPDEEDREWVGKVVAAMKGVIDGADLAVQGGYPAPQG
jgi:hypothetical protein